MFKTFYKFLQNNLLDGYLSHYKVKEALNNKKLIKELDNLVSKMKFSKSFSDNASIKGKGYRLEYFVSGVIGKRKVRIVYFADHKSKHVGSPDKSIGPSVDTITFTFELGNLEKFAYKNFLSTSNILTINFSTLLADYTITHTASEMSREQKSKSKLNTKDFYIILEPFLKHYTKEEVGESKELYDLFNKELKSIYDHTSGLSYFFNKFDFIKRCLTFKYYNKKSQKHKAKFEKVHAKSLNKAYIDVEANEFVKFKRTKKQEEKARQEQEERKQEERAEKARQQQEKRNNEQKNRKNNEEYRQQDQQPFPSTMFYQILGVSPDASIKDITNAYYALIRKVHPDHNPNDKYLEEIAKKLNIAYNTLKEPEKRQAYDKYLKTAKETQDWQL